MSRSIIKLTLIFLVALAVRLVVLDARPQGFSWDEAALGYNAYSLFKTGRDEYGSLLPLVLKSFGDYKPGLYAYLTVPAVATLGLSELATRLPAAIAGGLLMIAVYLLTKKIAPALILALNPWAIQFSRGAWEANVCLLFTVL